MSINLNSKKLSRSICHKVHEQADRAIMWGIVVDIMYQQLGENICKNRNVFRFRLREASIVVIGTNKKLYTI